MNAEQIAQMAAGGETETLECKKSTGSIRSAAMSICALLNHRGGHVLFGVTPDGKAVGQPVSDRTLEDVSAAIAQIDPQAFPTVSRVPVSENRDLIVVKVNKGTSGPYRYRGTAYRRVGNTTIAMGTEEYNRVLLERIHGEQRWENQPADGWTVSDLDLTEVLNTVAEAVRIGRLSEPNTREPEELLRGLGLFRGGVLLRAAAVLFGNAERLQFEMPQCRLRVARFRGFDRMEFLDNRQFHGNTFQLLASAERFLRESVPIAGRFKPDQFRRIDSPLYPPMATREALANALCHRDYGMGSGSVGLAVYDDRLEVTSIGGLHFGLTPDALFKPHESRPWNPVIARTLYRRGFIEEWGRGTIMMAEIATAAGMPHPEIEDSGDWVTVRFRLDAAPAIEQNGDLAARQNLVLALLDEVEEGLPLREIQTRFPNHVTKRQIKRTLETLGKRGLVRTSGTGRSSRWSKVSDR